VPWLEATQLRGGVFSARVHDESAGAELGACQVLELVPASVGRVELDVKMMVRAAGAWWLLMHRHHIGQRDVEQAIVLLPVAQRSKVHLVRPPCKRRHECDPPVISKDRPFSPSLSLEHVAIDAASSLLFVHGVGAQLALHDGRDEWVGIDLAVRMAESHSDRLASILEYVDVTDIRQAAQLLGAVTPYLDQVLDVIDRRLTKRLVVHRRVAHDLTSPLLSSEGWESVFEDCDVIVGLRDLCFEMPWLGGAERAVIRRRMVGAVLTPGRDSDPFLKERMPAKLAQIFSK